MKVLFIFLIALSFSVSVIAQDSALLKIHHAEPLYIDLIRDLGARKGEKEWNMGWGIKDGKTFISYSGFVEYEFSPCNRWGLEVELPFSFYKALTTDNSETEMPRHRIEGLKTAGQYTFLVSSHDRLSMAIGYMNELKFHSFITMSDRRDVIKGNAYSPFLIVAKRWGGNFHSLLYTGATWEQAFNTGIFKSFWQVNASIHYVIPGTSHFLGLECNGELRGRKIEAVIRPQAKIKVAEGLYLGMLTGIPMSFENQRMSFMVRVIYEPKKKL